MTTFQAAAWLRARPPWQRMITAVLAGAGAAGALAPISVAPLILVGLFIFGALVAVAESSRQAAWVSWAWATGYFAHGLSWIVEPFLVDAARHGWMAPFALVFMAGGLALFCAAAGWAAHRLGQGPAVRPLILTVTLALAEFGRAYLFTGFPWAALAQGLISTPMIQLLAWTGPHGLALWMQGAVFLPVAALFWYRPLAKIAAIMPWITLVASGFVTDLALQEADMTEQIVRIVQPNASQDQKWDPDYVHLFFNRQVDYTSADPRPDLVVWPEISIPWVLEDAAPAFEIMADAARGAPIAVGVQRLDGPRYYNSIVRVDADGTAGALYDKHHLVPFGEYMPLGNLLARVGIHGLAANDGGGFSTGPGPALISFGDLGQGLPLICYEAVFPNEIIAAERPDFLVHITNDAWFGTRSGPYQHLAQARMRAIETGLPVIRSANTGVSAMIAPKGRLIDSLPLGVAGYIDAPLPVPRPPTVYARIGDLPTFLIVFSLFCAVILRQVRAKSRNTG